MRTITKKVYGYNELSKKSQENALTQNNEINEMDNGFFNEDMNYMLNKELKKHKIKTEENVELRYSLSYSQGDGVSFIGQFKWKNYYITIERKTNSPYCHYVHSKTTIISIDTNYGNDAKTEVYEEFNEIYQSICNELETFGYKEIEYKQSEECFKEECNANECEFYENGEMI